MKKLLLALLVLPFLFAGCSSSDDDNGYGNNANYVPDQIAGTWVFEKSVAKEIKTNNSKADEVIKADIESEDDRQDRSDEIWTFNEDGTMVLQFGANDILTGFYTLTGNKIIMNLYDGVQLDEKLEGQIYLAENTLFFYYNATDYYKEDIRDLLSPNDYKETIINSVIVADSYKKAK